MLYLIVIIAKLYSPGNKTKSPFYANCQLAYNVQLGYSVFWNYNMGLINFIINKNYIKLCIYKINFFHVTYA